MRRAPPPSMSAARSEDLAQQVAEEEAGEAGVMPLRADQQGERQEDDTDCQTDSRVACQWSLGW